MHEYDMSPKRVIRFGPAGREPTWYMPASISTARTIQRISMRIGGRVLSLRGLPRIVLVARGGFSVQLAIDRSTTACNTSFDFRIANRSRREWSQVHGLQNTARPRQSLADTTVSNAVLGSICNATLFEGPPRAAQAVIHNTLRQYRLPISIEGTRHRNQLMGAVTS